MENKHIELAIKKISFQQIQRYLLSRNWLKVLSKKDSIGIFFTDIPFPTEIILPKSRDFADYSDLIIIALKKIADFENRELTSIINDLLLPPSDVIRYRITSTETEFGIISFDEGLSLIENAKKSLYATAFDLTNPSKFHKRMASKEIQDFINSCYLGQTEIGSYIATIVCPFIAEPIDEKKNQLTIFSPIEELNSSFTRKVTQKLMNSLSILKTSIEEDDYSKLDIDTENSNPIMSANFIESIVDIGITNISSQLEISTTWSSHIKMPDMIPNKIVFTHDYFEPMQSFVNKYKPLENITQRGSFVGKISRAQADPEVTYREETEILFNYLESDNKIAKAKVLLKPSSFTLACEALAKGQNVKISGLLKKIGTNRIIEDPELELIE